MLEKLHSNSCCVIHDNKDVLHDNNQFMFFYTLHKGNYCEDFMVKLIASSDRDLLVHGSPPLVGAWRNSCNRHCWNLLIDLRL